MYEYVGPPLTRETLEALLEELGVQPTNYSLWGAQAWEAEVIDYRSTGWLVFHTERGGEYDLRTYEAESDACLDLLKTVTSHDHVFFKLVAGPALPNEADAAFEAWLIDRSLTRTQLDPSSWKWQDSPWVAGAPDYRRYWVREVSFRY